MKAFILFNKAETHRALQIEQLAGKAPFPLVAVDAVFPAITRIPFLAKLLRLAKQRTGYPMQAA
ncbi:MAG: hypothetical protein ACKO41_05205, partial [Sphingomonadales bacterium]